MFYRSCKISEKNAVPGSASFPSAIRLCVIFEYPQPSDGVSKRPNGIVGSGAIVVVVVVVVAGGTVVFVFFGQQMKSSLCVIQIEVDC